MIITIKLGQAQNEEECNEVGLQIGLEDYKLTRDKVRRNEREPLRFYYSLSFSIFSYLIKALLIKNQKLMVKLLVVTNLGNGNLL